ncbi:MAG: Fic family protein [Alphaproteobacteria bacterium]|nr:Fic family protein [Alphaproteobacteria bacterium]
MDMRTETTHPWISFRLNLQKASPKLWQLLGEAKSKCQHLAGVPLKPAIAKNMHAIYLARGALATTAIEGNTLSEKEALKVVKGKSNLPKSQKYLAKEIENILTVTNDIMDEVEKRGDKDISSDDIKKYNGFILDGLAVEDHVVPGKYRDCGIEVSTYIGPTQEDVTKLVEDFCAWMNGQTFKVTSDDPLINAIIKAIVAHIYMAWIHPFGDGNGRTSRILEFRFLMEGGVPSPAAHLLSNHYNKTRTEYYKRLEGASKNGGDLLPFLGYAIEGFVDELREQLKDVKKQQWEVAWQNYIHEVLGDKKNASIQRQLRLLLALPPNNEYYSKAELVELSPQIARLYANKTTKTLSRDVNNLKKLGLIKIEDGKISAKAEIILSFLPRSKRGVLPASFEDDAEESFK